MTPGRLAGRVVAVGLLWFFGGTIGLVAGLAFVAYDVARSPSPSDLLTASVLCLGLVPLVVLARGLPGPATVGADFAAGNLVAHDLAGAGLFLLVVGVLREVRAGRGGAAELAPEPHQLPAPPAAEPEPPDPSGPGP